MSHIGYQIESQSGAILSDSETEETWRSRAQREANRLGEAVYAIRYSIEDGDDESTQGPSVRVAPERCDDTWWAWHDRDAERWSPSVEEAEARCAAWVAGESDDGPAI